MNCRTPLRPLPLSLLLAAIPFTLFLAQRATDIKPRAHAAPATVTDSNNGNEIDIQFGNGHHMLWAKTGCELDAWKDANGHILGRFLEFQVNIPSGIGGTTYPSNRRIQNYTTAGDSVTIN